MKKPQRTFKVAVIALLVCLTGCASAPKAKTRYFWPTPPDEPKIEFLGAYHGANDLTEKNIMTAITGEAEDLTIDYPMAVASDGAGKVYVTDLAARIVEFDLSLRVAKPFGSGTESITKACGIALDGDGNVYVGDMVKPLIMVFNKDGKPVSLIDLTGQAKSVGFFAIDRERKRLVIPDHAASKVHIAELNGKITRTITTWGKDKDEDGFLLPYGATFDRQGNIIVADTMNGRVVRFTPDGEFLSKFGRSGDSEAGFGVVKGVAVDSEGHIYLTDSRGHKLLIFSDKGEYLLSFGTLAESSLQLIGSFALPLGIFIDRNDTIYIADRMNKRFQMFQYMNAGYLEKNPVKKDEVAKPLGK